jgi:hypothetical protein
MQPPLTQGSSMKKLLVAVLTLLPSFAFAADLPVKALTPIPVMYPYQSSGLFFGIFTEGGGGSVAATVPGVGPASLTTTDAGLGATIGYAWGTKGSPVAYSIEGDFGFTNFNGNNAGLALAGPLSFEQRFVVFTPFNNLASMLPNLPNIFGTVPPFPALQPGLTASNLQMGFSVGVKEKDISTSFVGVESNKVWRVEPVIKLIAMEQLSNGTALRAWAGVAFPDKGAIIGTIPGIGTTSATLGPEALVGVGVYF